MIVKLLVAIATSSKYFSKIFEEATTLYYDIQYKREENRSVEVSEERDRLQAELSKEGLSDEEKRNIRKRLIALSRL